jgi:hypothetical protein
MHPISRACFCGARGRAGFRDGRPSTGRRRVERDEGPVADELVIVDRVGRLQLPRHLVEELGLRDPVRVRREGESLRIFRG